MYKIPHFTEQEESEIQSFMHAHPFVTLIGSAGNTSAATQIPLLVNWHNNKLSLRGHIIRHTDHHKVFTQNPQALILFTGPQCYVSASWYNERGHGSTWNYITVHVRGNINFLNDAATLKILEDLTNTYEQKQEVPELVYGMTDNYLQANIKAIAGFEVEVTDIYPIFKLSQNRNDESYKRIVDKLELTGKCDEQKIAEAMKNRRPQLFK